VGRAQHAIEHGAVPDLLGEARAAREGLADLLQPGRQRRREGQQRSITGSSFGPGAQLSLRLRSGARYDGEVAGGWASWRRSGRRPSPV
jgi:hypothetical protein